MNITPRTIQATTSAAIAAILDACGKNHVDLAQLLGKDPSGISRRLRGNSRWTLEELATIAEATGAPVTTFFDGEELRAFTNKRQNRRFTLIDGGPDLEEPPTVWYAPVPLAA